jgi:hypothetical protein
MTLMDSDKFLRLGGPSPRLELFPGQQETSETPRPQRVFCFANPKILLDYSQDKSLRKPELRISPQGSNSSGVPQLKESGPGFPSAEEIHREGEAGLCYWEVSIPELGL